MCYLALPREPGFPGHFTCSRPTILLLLSLCSQHPQSVAFPANLCLSWRSGFLPTQGSLLHPHQISGVLGSLWGFCFCFFIYFFISVVSIRASLSNSESLALWNISPILSNEPTATSPWDPMLPLLPPSLLFPLGTPGPCVSLTLQQGIDSASDNPTSMAHSPMMHKQNGEADHL